MNPKIKTGLYSVGILTFFGMSMVQTYRLADTRNELATLTAKLEKKIDFQDKRINDILAFQKDALAKLQIAKKNSIRDEYIRELVSIKRQYNKRYNDTYDTKIVVWTWDGITKKNAPKEQLTQTIKSVLQRLSFVPDNDNIISLLLETSCVESDRGRIVVQKRGPALGIYQVEPETEKDILAWLKAKHTKEYQEVMFFYDKKQDEKWNLTYNVPYQTAVAAAVYWFRLGDKLAEKATTVSDRAYLWKAVYNTVKGKGTIERYLKTSNELA